MIRLLPELDLPSKSLRIFVLNTLFSMSLLRNVMRIGTSQLRKKCKWLIPMFNQTWVLILFYRNPIIYMFEIRNIFLSFHPFLGFVIDKKVIWNYNNILGWKHWRKCKSNCYFKLQKQKAIDHKSKWSVCAAARSRTVLLRPCGVTFENKYANLLAIHCH